MKINLDLESASFKDITPILAILLSVCPDGEWEGKSLLE